MMGDECAIDEHTQISSVIDFPSKTIKDNVSIFSAPSLLLQRDYFFLFLRHRALCNQSYTRVYHCTDVLSRTSHHNDM